MTIIPDITALIVSVIVVCLTLVLKRQFFEPLARAMEAREAAGPAAPVRPGEAAEADATAAGNPGCERGCGPSATRAIGRWTEFGARPANAPRATLTTARAQAAATLEAGKDSLREQSARAASELEQVAESLASDLTARVLRRAS